MGIKHRDVKKIVRDVTSCLDKYDDDVINEGIMSARNAVSKSADHTEFRYDDIDADEKTTMQYPSYFDDQDGDVYDEDDFNGVASHAADCMCLLCIKCTSIAEGFITRDVRRKLNKIVTEATSALSSADHVVAYNAVMNFLENLKQEGSSLYDFLPPRRNYSLDDMINAAFDNTIRYVDYDIHVDITDPEVRSFIRHALRMHDYIQEL